MQNKRFHRQKQTLLKNINAYQTVSAAAAVVITLFIVRHNVTKTGDYAFIDGECTTNKTMVHQEAEAALDMVSANEGEDFQALSQIGGTSNEE